MTHSQPYLALPSSGRGPGVLVLHAWWGLNDFFRSFCDRLAQAGFAVLAPDLFGGEVMHTIAEAEQHLSQWDEEKAVPPILLPAVSEFCGHPACVGSTLAVIGFSMGAYWSLWLAQERPELVRSVTLFYGTDGGGGDFSRSKAKFQGHFAENDPYEPKENVDALEQALKQAGRPVSFYRYPGTGHWFFESDRPQTYNDQAADLAWESTLEFLKQ